MAVSLRSNFYHRTVKTIIYGECLAVFFSFSIWWIHLIHRFTKISHWNHIRLQNFFPFENAFFFIVLLLFIHSLNHSRINCTIALKCHFPYANQWIFRQMLQIKLDLEVFSIFGVYKKKPESHKKTTRSWFTSFL